MVCLSCTGKAVVARYPTTTVPSTSIPLMLPASVFPDIHIYSVNANSTINITKAECIRWADSTSTHDFTHHDFPKDNGDI